MYVVTSLCICELNGTLMVIVYDIALHKNVSSTVIGMFLLSYFVCQTNSLRYDDGIDNRSVVSVSFKYEILCSVAS